MASAGADEGNGNDRERLVQARTSGRGSRRVSFFMNKFRQLGLIDYNGQIEVHSSLLNVVLRDQPQIRTVKL